MDVSRKLGVVTFPPTDWRSVSDRRTRGCVGRWMMVSCWLTRAGTACARARPARVETAVLPTPRRALSGPRRTAPVLGCAGPQSVCEPAPVVQCEARHAATVQLHRETSCSPLRTSASRLPPTAALLPSPTKPAEDL